MASRLPNLHHVIQERIRDLEKLVRDTMRHDDDVSLCDFPALTALDAAAAQFVWGNVFCFDGFAARDESRRPLKYVDNVRVFRMDFGLAGRFSAAGVDHVVAP